MSRTKRKHWLRKDSLRDGIVRPHIKSKDTESKQVKGLLDYLKEASEIVSTWPEWKKEGSDVLKIVNK